MLSACYDLKGELTVGEDDTVSGTMSISAPSELYAQMPELAQAGEDLPAGMTAEPLKADGYEGFTYTLDQVALTDLTEREGRGFPLTVTRDAAGYTVEGDFTSWFPKKGELQQQGLTIPGTLPPPRIALTLTLPTPIVDAPEGAPVEGSTLTLTEKWLMGHKTFAFKAPVAPEAPAPAPAAEPTVSAFPIPDHGRNPIPLYVFSLMVVGGLGLMFYGRFGAVAAKAPAGDKSAKASKAKAKKSKKRK